LKEKVGSGCGGRLGEREGGKEVGREFGQGRMREEIGGGFNVGDPETGGKGCRAPLKGRPRGRVANTEIVETLRERKYRSLLWGE